MDELTSLHEARGNGAGATLVGGRALSIAEAAVGRDHPSLVDRQRAQAGRLQRTPANRAAAEGLLKRAQSLEALAQEQAERFVTMGPGSSGQKTGANAELVRVFFATNRQPRPGAKHSGVRFSSKRNRSSAELSYGEVMVSMPREVELVGIREGRYWVGEIRKGEYRKAVLGKLTPFASATPFATAMRQKIDSSTRRELLIFVHGYANDWQVAVQRTAALSVALELDGAPLLFSWPSRGDFLSYVADGNEVTTLAVEQLTGLLRTAVQQSGAERIYVICHSMGARFVLSALERFGAVAAPRPPFSSMVFASPDVDADDFSLRAPKVSRFASTTTMYVSARDRALRLSQFVNDALRAGEVRANLAPAGIDAVDTTQSTRDVWNVDSLIRHDDFATGALDDVRALIWHGLKPSSRCILAQRKLPAGVVWNLGTPGCPPDTFKMGVHAARRLGAAQAVSFLSINERESCKGAPSGDDCQAWRSARAVAEVIHNRPER